MTISNNYQPDKSLGNGATVDYTGNWNPLADDYFRLAFQSVATGVITVKTPGLDYSLTFDESGYHAVLSAPATSANYVLRYREVSQDQTDPYKTSKGFQGKVQEDSFDKLTAICQDQQDQIDRSIKFQVGSIAVGSLPDPVDGYCFGWDGTSGAIKNLFSGVDIANAASYAAAAAASATSANVSSITAGFAAQDAINAAARAEGRRALPNFPNNGALVAQRSNMNAPNFTTARAIGWCDNIKMWAPAGAVTNGTITQVSNSAAGSTGYAARGALLTLTGSAVVSCAISMEANEAVKYKNRTISFGCNVTHDVGGFVTYGLRIKIPTVKNNFTAFSYDSGDVTLLSIQSGVNNQIIFEGLAIGDCSNGLEIEVRAYCNAVTTKNFDFTDFNINPGIALLPYYGEEYMVELARCQRYLPAWNGADTYGVGQGTSTTAAYIALRFPVETLFAPTSVLFSNVAQFLLTNAAAANNALSALAFASPTGKKGAFLTASVSPSTTLLLNQATILFNNNAGAALLFLGSELI